MTEHQDFVNRINNLFLHSPLLPEPFANSLFKYLALTNFETDTDVALINVCNSHGIQARNFINYLSQSTRNKTTPILDPSDFKLLLNMDDLKSKLKCFPSEWTVIQLSLEYSTDILLPENEGQKRDPTFYITKLPCGNNLDRVAPYMIKIPPPENTLSGVTIRKHLIDTQANRENYYKCKRNKRLLKVFHESDAEIASILNELDTYWLREWKCLLSGKLVDESLEKKLLKKTERLLDEVASPPFKNRERTLDILLQLVLHAHLLKPKEIVRAAKFALYGDSKSAEDEQLLELFDGIHKINEKNLAALKAADWHPLILIIEPHLEMFPWELSSVTQNKPVTRLLSFHMLNALYKYHEKHIQNGYRLLPVSSAFCVLNPDKSLKDCEKEVGDFLKSHLPWFLFEAREIPDPEDIAEHFKENSVFLYCGHGSMGQYLPSGVSKMLVNCMVILVGCSSILPRGKGGRTPYQNNTYFYLNNGCPLLIGAIYDLSSSDADLMAISLLGNALPHAAVVDGNSQIMEPKVPNVLNALLEAKKAAHHFWSKCSFVARGLPVKIIVTDADKEQLLKTANEREL